jgi:hypothetical protein
MHQIIGTRGHLGARRLSADRSGVINIINYTCLLNISVCLPPRSPSMAGIMSTVVLFYSCLIRFLHSQILTTSSSYSRPRLSVEYCYTTDRNINFHFDGWVFTLYISSQRWLSLLRIWLSYLALPLLSVFPSWNFGMG